MGDKNRFSRWRRLPPVFRSGEHKLPGYEDETQRLTLYLPGSLLDLAQEFADQDEIPSIQEFCSRLLARSLEAERSRRRVADVEARRGRLKGLDEVAHDPDYLAEWQGRRELANPRNDGLHAPIPPTGELTVPLVHLPDAEAADPATSDGSIGPPLTVRVATGPRPEPVVADKLVPEIIDGRAMDILWKHVGPEGGDPDGFLPRMRRGEPVPATSAAELLAALRSLEEENRGTRALDRKLAYALHRVALESQVLMTEAWPGAFDEPTIEAVRAVQEMVERILSGEDVRYYADAGDPSAGGAL